MRQACVVRGLVDQTQLESFERRQAMLHMRGTTNPGMLHQSQALESVSADTPQGGTKRDTDTIAEDSLRMGAGMQPGRDEIPTLRDVVEIGASPVSSKVGGTVSGGNSRTSV